MKQFSGFIPRTDGQRTVWAANNKKTMAELGVSLGFSADELSTYETKLQTWIDSINQVETDRTTFGKAVSAKKALSLEVGTLVRATAARIKASPVYTEDMGKDLGIVDNGQQVDVKNVRPSMKVSTGPGYVRLRFNKSGMPAVTIYTRLKGSTGWDKLGNAKNSPYLDKRPLAVANQPETREYMAICFDSANDVGQSSDIVSAVFGG
jgi:hypothetical protein